MPYNTRGANNHEGEGGEEGVGLTFEQQQALIKLQIEADERRAQLQAEAEQRKAEATRAEAEVQLRLVQAQIDLANAQAAIPQPQPAQQHGFRVTDAIKMTPVFDERDIDLFMANFEKLAISQNWPRAQWAAVLTPTLKGAKSLRALNRLRPEQVSDYDALKKAIVDEYELVPEAYRNRFRSCVKRQGDSFSDFNQFMCNQFERWIASVEATNNLDVLKNVICMEQFMSKCPDDIRQYLLDKGCKTSYECARRADEYVIMHKTTRKDNFNSKPTHGNGQGHSGSQGNGHSIVQGNGSGNFVRNHDGKGNGHNVSKSNNNASHQFEKLCYVCHRPGHLAVHCPNRFDTSVKGVKAVVSRPVVEGVNDVCRVEVVSRDECVDVSKGYGPYMMPVCFYNSDSSRCVSLTGFRDSGADITLLMCNAVPSEYLVDLGRSVPLEFANGSSDSVPMYRANVATAGVCGELCVGLVPESYRFPNGAKVLLGNDYGTKLTSKVSAVTRSQTRAERASENASSSGCEQGAGDVGETPVTAQSVAAGGVQGVVSNGDGGVVDVQSGGAVRPQPSPVSSALGLDIDVQTLAAMQHEDKSLMSCYESVGLCSQ